MCWACIEAEKRNTWLKHLKYDILCKFCFQMIILMKKRCYIHKYKMWESNHCYCYNIINWDLFLGLLDTGSLIIIIITQRLFSWLLHVLVSVKRQRGVPELFMMKALESTFNLCNSNLLKEPNGMSDITMLCKNTFNDFSFLHFASQFSKN